MLEADATQDAGVSKQILSKREIDYEALIKKRAEASGREYLPTQGVEVKEDEGDETQKKELPTSDEDGDKELIKTDEGEVKEEEKPIPKQDGIVLTFLDDQGQEIKVPATAKIRLKVDGQEVDESLDRVTRGYQKGAAADKRLEQATKLQRELEQKERHLADMGAALSQREEKTLKILQGLEQKKEAGKLSQDAYRDAAQRIVDALLKDENPVESLAAVLPEIMYSSQNAPVDIGQLKTSLKAELKGELKQDIELDTAISDFNRDFRELAEDPRLFKMVDEETVVLMKLNPELSHGEIIRKAAEKVREWKDGMAGTPKPDTPKKESSAGGGSRPKPKPSLTASGRASIGEDVKPESRRDIINQMRQSRGQPPL
ncbi:MAG: hypothetical protein QME44_01775 [Thermodesulfobacteriota bacterium]|nr:hypothetical protein [Thermodesulfobacteriota bacterium]